MNSKHRERGLSAVLDAPPPEHIQPGEQHLEHHQRYGSAAATELGVAAGHGS